jgi:FdhD protein
MNNLSLLARPVREVAMQRMKGSTLSLDRDFLAAEEPLEIRVEGHNIAIVMRTPGEDRELATGFLVTEGLLHTANDLVDIRHQHHCLFLARDASGRRIDVNDAPSSKEASQTGLGMNRSNGNVINVQLKNPEAMDLKKLTRHVFTSSSCGICSKSSIEAVRQQFPPIEDNFEVDPQVLFDLPVVLSSAQESFKRTGGLHACALFDSDGNLLVIHYHPVKTHSKSTGYDNHQFCFGMRFLQLAQREALVQIHLHSKSVEFETD